MTRDIAAIRSFHRALTQRVGALSDRYLDRDRPLAESRLLYEIGNAGAPVGELKARLGLDSGFLSRTLRALERDGLVATLRRAGTDGRTRFARLTRAGRAELKTLNRLSDRLARSILAPLSPGQGTRLVAAMADVERLLRAADVEIGADSPTSRDAAHCLRQYFAEIDERFREGFDASGGLAAAATEFVSPAGTFLLARLDGKPVGCVAMRSGGRGIGEIKRMWVCRSARGLGIGRRLLRELERIARSRRLQRLRLDTNESLLEARSLYRACGFAEIERYNDDPYAHYWFEKRL